MPTKNKVASILAGLLFSQVVSAQNQVLSVETNMVVSADTISKGKYTLVFVNKSIGFDNNISKQLIDVFFKVYPAQAKIYNKNTLKQVTFVIDPAYKGVAATFGGGVIRYNPEWFQKHPRDIDVVTHETMHVIQSYGRGSGPGWITEGIADYVRYKMGLYNKEADWKLPEYSPKQNFDNSYRITARFFVWIENRYDKKFVKKLDKAMREKTYTDEFARNNTGKTFAELWAEYGANPAI